MSLAELPRHIVPQPSQGPARGVAMVDGRIVPVSEARIPLMDWGFLRSDACQDTVSVWRGRFFCLDDHIDRFLQSCRHLQLICPYSREELAEVLKRLVRASGLADAYVQMIMTRGLPEPGSRDLRTCRNSFLAFCVPYIHIAPDSGRGQLDLIVSERPRIATQSVPSSIKNYHWIDFELGLLEAYERGGNSVVLTDGDGGITEGPGFNIFSCRAGRLATPAANVLDGITRRVVIELAQELHLTAEERRVGVAELEGADEVLATSTAGGIMTVRSVNGRVLPNAPGPITRELAKIYWERREKGWRGTPVGTHMEVDVNR
jgi:branched-chain amino acid aminotransferase